MTIYEYIECDKKEIREIFVEMGRPAEPAVRNDRVGPQQINFTDIATGHIIPKSESYNVLSKYFSNLLGYAVTVTKITFMENIAGKFSYETDYLIYFNGQEL